MRGSSGTGPASGERTVRQPAASSLACAFSPLTQNARAVTSTVQLIRSLLPRLSEYFAARPPAPAGRNRTIRAADVISLGDSREAGRQLAFDTTSDTSIGYAQVLDAGDELARFRRGFYLQPGSIYLDGNSLGLS